MSELDTRRRVQLSVIIPIYNEESNIDELYQRLLRVLEPMPLAGGFELIFINDGSRDQSLPLLLHLAVRDPRVRYIDFSRNFGHQIAVTAVTNAPRAKPLLSSTPTCRTRPNSFRCSTRRCGRASRWCTPSGARARTTAPPRSSRPGCFTGCWPASRTFPSPSTPATFASSRAR